MTKEKKKGKVGNKLRLRDCVGGEDKTDVKILDNINLMITGIKQYKIK